MPPKIVRFADSASNIGRTTHAGHGACSKPGKQQKSKPKKRRSRAKEVEAIMNKGLVAEFVIFLVFQGFDMFSNVWVLNESVVLLRDVEKYEDNWNISRSNNTVVEFCAEFQWSKERVDKEMYHFRMVLGFYGFFISLASLTFTLHLLAWVYTLQLALRSRVITQATRDSLVKMKLIFLVAESVLQDIPMSAITAELFTIQQGRQGFTCWYCGLSGLCPEMKQFSSLIERSSTAILLNVGAIGLTSLWKGISSFYRWSKIPNFSFFHLRACTSVFTGGLFAIVILTPAMTVLKYRYLVQPGITASFLADAIDRVYIIGVIAWVFCASVLCCCPLLHVIRMTS